MKKTIFDEMRRIRRRMNRFFGGFDEDIWNIDEEDLSNYRKPWVEASETEKEFVVAVELPGVKKEDIELSVDERGLTIRVEKKKQKEEKEKNAYRYERSYVGFFRRIPMPERADLDNINAEYKNGILKMIIPKKAKTVRNHKIRIE